MASDDFAVASATNMTLNEALVQVNYAMGILNTTEDYSTDEVVQALCILRDLKRFDEENSVEKEATKLGLGGLFVKISKSLEHHSDRSRARDIMTITETLFWNYADDCSELGCDLGKCGAVEYTLNTLNVLEKQPKDERDQRRLFALFGILHNAIYHEKCGVNRAIYRKAGAVAILKKYLESTNMLLKVECLLTLVYIVDEKESEILGRDNAAVVLLINMLAMGVEAPDHCALILGQEFSVAELLDGLNRLTINDDNKTVVLIEGGLHVISRILLPDFTKEERRLAAKSVWNLTFVDSIRETDDIDDCLKALNDLAISEDESLRKISKYALWEMADKDEGYKECEEDDSNTDEGENGAKGTKGKSYHGNNTKVEQEEPGGHVMISYNWAHQTRALQIRDLLQNEGYRVWIDVDKMSGDTLECMANAVKQADVILLCMSQKYYESTSCRSEAKYAYKKKKSVIPLLIEANYQPEGWLDILIETELYYKVCTDKDMQANMRKVIAAIGNRGRESARKGRVNDFIDGPEQAQTLTTCATTATSTVAWSSQQVQDWLIDIGLPKLCSPLDFCDGCALEDMYEKYCRDKEGFEKDCRSDLDLKYFEVLKLSTGLKRLFLNK